MIPLLKVGVPLLSYIGGPELSDCPLTCSEPDITPTEFKIGVTLPLSVTSAVPSILFSFDNKVSVKLFVSDSLNNVVLISAPVWSG